MRSIRRKHKEESLLPFFVTLSRVRLQSVQGLLDVNLPHAKDDEIKAPTFAGILGIRSSSSMLFLNFLLSLWGGGGEFGVLQAWKDQRGQRLSQAKKNDVDFEAGGESQFSLSS